MNARRQEYERLLEVQARRRDTSAQISASVPHAASTADLANADREAMLRRRIPRMARYEVARVGEIAIQTMLSVPAWSQTSDLHGLTYLMRFGAWVHLNEGCFDPTTQMTDDRIEAWIDQTYRHARPTTRDSAYSSLRRIRDHRERRGPTRRGNRPPARMPHDPLEWAHFEATAQGLRTMPVGQSLRMLLDLTGECGLRPDEAIRADGKWIEARGSEVVVIATNHRGVAREIPVRDHVAARLRPLAGSRELLILPSAPKKRHNTISSVLIQANRYSNGGMEGFSAQRARHMWLMDLMRQPISFLVLASVADINPGSHMPCDLLPYAPVVDPRAAAATLRRRQVGRR